MEHDYTADIDYNEIEEVDSFEDLPDQVRRDLLAWYNSLPTAKEEALLLDLYLAGQFRAWDCPECGDRVFDGWPLDGNWDNFQGTLNRDFSYFGNTDKYQQDYLMAMCDHCRCWV